MRKYMLVSIVIALVIALSACGNAQRSSASATATTQLSQEGQLLVGTLKLESTSLAVSSIQASQLLPLWETLESLASSSTAATQEVDAVVSQIKSTMSSQQIASITAMDLTQKDLLAASQDNGVSSASSASAALSTASPVQPQAGDDMGGGNPPANMGGSTSVAMAVQASGQAQSGTSQTVTTQSSSASGQIPAALIKVLVDMLQKKVG